MGDQGHAELHGVMQPPGSASSQAVGGEQPFKTLNSNAFLLEFDLPTFARGHILLSSVVVDRQKKVAVQGSEGPVRYRRWQMSDLKPGTILYKGLIGCCDTAFVPEKIVVPPAKRSDQLFKEKEAFMISYNCCNILGDNLNVTSAIADPKEQAATASEYTECDEEEVRWLVLDKVRMSAQTHLCVCAGAG